MGREMYFIKIMENTKSGIPCWKRQGYQKNGCVNAIKWMRSGYHPSLMWKLSEIAGVTVPIHVIPLGVDPNYYHPEIMGYKKS